MTTATLPRPLSQAQVAAFLDRGFFVLPDLFSGAEIGAMRAAFDRLAAAARGLPATTLHQGSQFVLHRQPSGEMRIDRVVWCGASEPALLEFGADPRLLRPAAQLLGSGEMSHLINQAHFKLPGDGVSYPWHQDSSHRRYGQEVWRDVNGRGSYVQTVIAVDDMTDENGPLLFIPGSGRLGHTFRPDDRPLPAAMLRRAVPALMPAGSALFFSPYVFHSSRPNRSCRPRRAFINGFAYPGANTRVYPGEGSGRLLHLS